MQEFASERPGAVYACESQQQAGAEAQRYMGETSQAVGETRSAIARVYEGAQREFAALHHKVQAQDQALEELVDMVGDDPEVGTARLRLQEVRAQRGRRAQRRKAAEEPLW